MASRTKSKVDDSIKKLVTEHPQLEGRIKWVKLDLASLKATKAAAQDFLSREDRLDGIVNKYAFRLGYRDPD
jgi:NAD(P)-dependent dehydrogenase (short-subunit alcohol dehydrogenase family)